MDCKSFIHNLCFQSGKMNEEYTAPPSASELPPPELFTQMHPQEQIVAMVPPTPENGNQVGVLVIEILFNLDQI